MENACWLKSAGQYNSGTVYSGLFEWCVSKLNAGAEGFKNSTETYTDYDFVINTTDHTFRLPLKTKTAPLGATAPVKSDGVVPLWALSSNKSLEFPIMKGQAASTVKPLYLNTNNNPDTTVLFGSSTGLETDLSNADSPEGVYLYFYAGNVEENADLINIGEITNALTNKADITAVTAICMPDYTNGDNNFIRNTWYTVQKDCYVSSSVVFRGSNKDYISLVLKDKEGNLIQNGRSGELYGQGNISVVQIVNGVGDLGVEGFVPDGYSFKVNTSAEESFHCTVYPLKGAQ